MREGRTKNGEPYGRDSHDHRVSGLDEQEDRGAGPSVAPAQAWGGPRSVNGFPPVSGIVHSP
jgi:hypothetical protein